MCFPVSRSTTDKPSVAKVYRCINQSRSLGPNFAMRQPRAGSRVKFHWRLPVSRPSPRSPTTATAARRLSTCTSVGYTSTRPASRSTPASPPEKNGQQRKEAKFYVRTGISIRALDEPENA